MGKPSRGEKTKGPYGFAAGVARAGRVERGPFGQRRPKGLRTVQATSSREFPGSFRRRKPMEVRFCLPTGFEEVKGGAALASYSMGRSHYRDPQFAIHFSQA
jgi:hypothetical protein